VIRFVGSGAGAVEEPLRTLLRLEGGFVALLATWAFFHFGGDWRVFLAAFMLPDCVVLAYRWSNRIGSLLYNLTHWYVLPLIALVVWMVGDHPDARNIALIWLAHIGSDRALGFGLKYARDFRITHLGVMGGRVEREITATTFRDHTE